MTGKAWYKVRSQSGYITPHTWSSRVAAETEKARYSGLAPEYGPYAVIQVPAPDNDHD